ncbi:MAG TPA: S24 family peptidase, partial [Candidatus Methylomirabilis sp.]|nr:S24 family peptidase [Candidatus Methylomirabilis sp.]
SLDEYLIENKEATFILKVSGESMIDAGIMPGDMVLVERGRDPRDGDIVIAEVDNAWTMKYFRKKGNKIILEPANKKFSPIIPKSDLRVAAVVRSVIRKY